MRKLTKLLSLLLVLCMVFSLAACGGGSSAEKTEEKAPETQPESEPEAEEPEAEPEAEEPEAEPEAEAEPEISEAAQKYATEKNITWYTQGPGNVADTIARIIGPKLGEILGTTVVIENADGAGGMNELNPVLAADADGYTLASIAVAFLCMTPFSQDCTYDYTDFELMCNVMSQPQCLFVNADAPYNTFEEWVEYVKEHPGEVNIGVPGVSTVHNFALQGLMLETGLEFNTIAYSTSELTQATLGGHVDGAVAGYTELSAGVDSGDLKILAFTTTSKLDEYADIPTFEELGYTSKGVAFQGIGIKAGADPDVVDKLDAALTQVLTDPDVIEQLKAANLWYEGTYQGREEFTETVKSTYEFYEEVLTDTGLMEELYG